MTKPCFENCYRDFNSRSAREQEYHMKPKRPVFCVSSRAIQYAEEPEALSNRLFKVLIGPIDSHSPSPPKTDQGRSVSGVGIYPNGDTRQSKHIAYVSVLDARSANKLWACGSRCLCWANIRDERLRTQRQMGIALAVDRNCWSYQTRLIGKSHYDSRLEHPIVLSYISSPRHQPRLGAPLLCDLV